MLYSCLKLSCSMIPVKSYIMYLIKVDVDPEF